MRGAEGPNHAEDRLAYGASDLSSSVRAQLAAALASEAAVYDAARALHARQAEAVAADFEGRLARHRAAILADAATATLPKDGTSESNAQQRSIGITIAISDATRRSRTGEVTGVD